MVSDPPGDLQCCSTAPCGLRLWPSRASPALASCSTSDPSCSILFWPPGAPMTRTRLRTTPRSSSSSLDQVRAEQWLATGQDGGGQATDGSPGKAKPGFQKRAYAGLVPG